MGQKPLPTPILMLANLGFSCSEKQVEGCAARGLASSGETLALCARQAPFCSSGDWTLVDYGCFPTQLPEPEVHLGSESWQDCSSHGDTWCPAQAWGRPSVWVAPNCPT